MTSDPSSENPEMTETDQATDQATTVLLCVPTFRRPVGLARLLDAIVDLERPASVDVGVVVVDNDPDGSSRSVAQRFESDLDVHYVVEPTRGVADARNRALAVAHALGCDWIGWLDDDEAPESDWLVRMLSTQVRYGADVVFGPNEPVFEPGAAEWLAESDLYHFDRFATGERYPYFHTRTSGVLMRAAIVPDERFDVRLSLTGGEDRLFFTRVHRAGGVFVYDADALVHEFIPLSRTRVSWLLRRWYRTGVTRSLTMLYLDEPGWPRRLRRVAGGLLMGTRGLLSALVAVPRGRVPVLRGARLALIGVGSSVGALGFEYREYRKVHGR